MVKHDLHAAMVLKRNKLEGGFSLEQFILDLPFRRHHPVVLVTKTVPVVYDAAYLHVRKCERFHVDSNVVPLDDRLVKGLPFKLHDRAIAMNSAPANAPDAEAAAAIGEFNVCILPSRIG